MTDRGPAHGAVRSRRDPGVDAVRGLALLGSAVGTALVWLGGRPLGSGFRPLDGDGLDRAADVVTGLLVDNRVLAVFALLLGYGVAARMPPPAGRGAHAPPDEAEWADGLRRAGVLLGLGLLHAVLVFEADVLATLAVLLIVAVPLARARTRTHVAVAVLVVPALLVHGALDGFGGSLGLPDPPQDYLRSVVDRVGTWLLGLVLLIPTASGLLVAVIAGIRLARSGWGADPAVHRRGLLAVGVVAGLVGLAGSVPYARVLGAGVLPDVVVGLWSGVGSSVTGPVGALGAVCLGLVAASSVMSPAPGATGPARAPAPARVLEALVLLGRRSLPVYLAHSVVLAAVLAPWAGGAGSRWGSAAVTALAVALWSATFVAALVAGRPPVRRPARQRSVPAQPNELQGRERSSAT